MTGLGAQPKKESSRERKLNDKESQDILHSTGEYSQYFVRIHMEYNL